MKSWARHCLRTLPTLGRDESPCPIRLKFVARTETHTQRRDCTTRTTREVGKIITMSDEQARRSCGGRPCSGVMGSLTFATFSSYIYYTSFAQLRRLIGIRSSWQLLASHAAFTLYAHGDRIASLPLLNLPH